MYTKFYNESAIQNLQSFLRFMSLLLLIPRNIIVQWFYIFGKSLTFYVVSSVFKTVKGHYIHPNELLTEFRLNPIDSKLFPTRSLAQSVLKTLPLLVNFQILRV